MSKPAMQTHILRASVNIRNFICYFSTKIRFFYHLPT